MAQYAPGQPGPSYYAGSPVLVTAAPNAGYELQVWSGACAGAGTCIATMNASKSVTATFGPARTWTEIFPPVSPSVAGGSSGRMAYDKARNQTVLIDDQIVPGPSMAAPGLQESADEFDSGFPSPVGLRRSQCSSRRGGGNGVFETWVWDGTTWTLRSPATHPSVREAFGLAYDGALGQVVLFGGENGAADLSDTWLWDGGAMTWTQILPTHVPTARAAPSMAYDSVRQQVVLFGGQNVTGGVVTSLNDTWAFTGADWVQQSPATPPAARNCSAMAWDEAHQQMVLFGGPR